MRGGSRFKPACRRGRVQGSRLVQSVRFWQIATLLLAASAIATQLFSIPVTKKHSPVKTAMAAEIYPEFSCPCCGQPLNKEEPCCGLMQEMIDFIDQKVSEGLSQKEVELATVKRFGWERLISQEKQEEVKNLLLAQAPPDAPRISLSTEFKDLGEVSIAQGEASTDFEIENLGQSDLVISKLSSSCGCTSAAIIYRGEEGPRFYMAGHGQENPQDWQVAIKPDDTAILRVYYDPAVHPDLTGAVTREVTIFSNDPVEFSKKVRIELVQTK